MRLHKITDRNSSTLAHLDAEAQLLYETHGAATHYAVTDHASYLAYPLHNGFRLVLVFQPDGGVDEWEVEPDACRENDSGDLWLRWAVDGDFL